MHPHSRAPIIIIFGRGKRESVSPNGAPGPVIALAVASRRQLASVDGLEAPWYKTDPRDEEYPRVSPCVRAVACGRFDSNRP